LSSCPLIAIVEDDAFVREATGTLIRSLGFEAVAFPSAEEFLASSAPDEASCVITDVQMPGLGGLGLQTNLLARGNRTPIIFITAFPEDRIRAQAMSSGAVGFLSKPFKEELLIDCIETALGAGAAPMV
jgi:FixJ family two-component response regulator